LKRSSVILLVEISAVYFLVLVVARSFLPNTSDVPLYFLALPMVLVVLGLVVDLSGRTTKATITELKRQPRRKVGREVGRLTRQVEVGTLASPEYYQKVILGRLRDVLVERVSLETGIEKEKARDILINGYLGPEFLHDSELYRLLYSGTATAGLRRIADLEKALALIEAWKP